MKIRQFEDKHLSHFSYAVLSESANEMILIDPARDTKPYREFSAETGAAITGVIETHPHADFVSSHLALHQQLGATIYSSKLIKAGYPRQTFDDGDVIELGEVRFLAINTPGHSPDSISVLVSADGVQRAIFTGDTLFAGDVGRPDLRESNGSRETERHTLARQLFHSLRENLANVRDEVIVYPAHGAGTLCGKHLSEATSSTMYDQRQYNWAFQVKTEAAFVKELLQEQPFIPAYFPYNVSMNQQGAPAPVYPALGVKEIDAGLWTIDVRDGKSYKAGHLPHSINIMEGNSFETWLGSLIRPEERFYLTAGDEKTLQRMLARTAAIGYENKVAGAFVMGADAGVAGDAAALEGAGEFVADQLDVEWFREHFYDYTIVDVRNASEVKDRPIFDHSLSIPLFELQQRAGEIPVDRPIVVHCAGGYRSAAGSSLLQSLLRGKQRVLDLGEAVKTF
ncbi:MBL fold metallo-hydrolase [Puia dinghuensis]|uniref:MBL fold hydrolase n=1 Tax=Puia dinghuensis TaxID=1792502 RepID=A0A8J2UDJ5_9BACT|nr:MBL fold metallo-hydrolase [Puia dinghuensis]GGB02777.1 MBL fold hydrolase [Puia dinghuensis]